MFELKLRLIDKPNGMFSAGTVEIHSHDYIARSGVDEMIFPYIPTLLNGLMSLLQNPHIQTCSFPMFMSSFDFSLKWRYTKPQTISFFHKGKMINEHTTEEVVNAVRNETSRFVNLHSNNMNFDIEYESVKLEIFDSVTAFEQFTYL